MFYYIVKREFQKPEIKNYIVIHPRKLRNKSDRAVG